MPILLILLLTAACAPIQWPNPLGIDARASAELTVLAVAVPLALAFALRTWVVRSLGRAPGRRVAVGQRYDRLRRVFFFANLGSVAGAIALLGWGPAVWQTGAIDWNGNTILAPFAELLVPLPYFLVVLGCWLIHYDSERALRFSGADAQSPPRFWSRSGYFIHNLRQLALMVLLPVGLFVTQQSLLRVAPEIARADWFRVLSLAAVPMLLVFVPLLVKPLLGLRSLPAGPTRDRIEALARRLHFRYADLLLWPTHGSMANAMILGLVPRVRFVIFTDAILEAMPPDEIDAVFGHEVGHAHHGHIWFYALFLALSMTVLEEVLVLIGESHAGVVLGSAAVYLFLAFGFVSRRCERQADIFGCRAGSCSNPECTGHDATTVFPDRGAGLCPTGIRACARALDRVYALSGLGGHDDGTRWSLGALLRGAFGWLRAWQHFTVPRRIRFLLSLIDDPGRERRFQWRVWLLRWGLAIGLIAALVLLGEEAGWQNMLELL